MKCDICDFTTDIKASYAGHRSAHVRRGELEKRPIRVKQEHRCTLCDKVFRNGPALGGHARFHWSPEQLVISLQSKSGRSRRKALLVAGRAYRCELCNLEPFWNGAVLTLQLDHVDGNHQNNVIENLRFLCPNCHTQTSTYGRKKRS